MLFVGQQAHGFLQTVLVDELRQIHPSRALAYDIGKIGLVGAHFLSQVLAVELRVGIDTFLLHEAAHLVVDATRLLRGRVIHRAALVVVSNDRRICLGLNRPTFEFFDA